MKTDNVHIRERMELVTNTRQWGLRGWWDGLAKERLERVLLWKTSQQLLAFHIHYRPPLSVVDKVICGSAGHSRVTSQNTCSVFNNPERRDWKRRRLAEQEIRPKSERLKCNHSRGTLSHIYMPTIYTVRSFLSDTQIWPNMTNNRDLT